MTDARASRRVESRGRCEELERNAVWVTEGEARAVRRILDRTALDADLVEASGPLLELRAVRTSERDVVETDTAGCSVAEIARRVGYESEDAFSPCVQTRAWSRAGALARGAAGGARRAVM